MRPKPLIPTRTVMVLPFLVCRSSTVSPVLTGMSVRPDRTPGYVDVSLCVEHVGGEVGIRAGDTQGARTLVGHGQQPTNPAGHSVFGHLRLGELAELLKAGLFVFQAEPFLLYTSPSPR